MCCKKDEFKEFKCVFLVVESKRKFDADDRSNEWTAVVGIASFFGTTFHVSEFNFNFFGLENILLKRKLSSSLNRIDVEEMFPTQGYCQKRFSS